MRRGLESLGNGCSVSRGLSRAQIKSLEASVSEPAIERRWNSPDGVLQECKTILETVRVKGCDAHENVLHLVSTLHCLKTMCHNLLNDR
jgi:hypothetical protein